MSSVTIGVSTLTVEPLKHCLQQKYSLIEECDQGSFTFFELKTPGLVTQLLARVIIDELQIKWLQRLLQTHYSYFDQEEQLLIIEHTKPDLQRKAQENFQYMCQGLRDYLAVHNHLVVEGFIRFRMKAYWAFLRDTLDKAVDAYLMDQEYQEFIKLLRYFVELQEPKIGMVNVILHTNGDFKLMDNESNIIHTEYLEGIILEIGNNELDFEDLLISALITVAPSQIILHLHSDNHATQTILSIFDERVTLCAGCAICYDVEKTTES